MSTEDKNQASNQGAIHKGRPNKFPHFLPPLFSIIRFFLPLHMSMQTQIVLILEA